MGASFPFLFDLKESGMKTIFFFLLFLLCGNSLSNAQEVKSYLFESFEDATINFFNGTVTRQKMNYNILYSQMIYKDSDGTLKALSEKDTQSISQITIKGRTFIPFKQGICEILSVDPLLYVEYHSRLKMKGQNIGFGETSSTTAATNITRLRWDGVQRDDLLKATHPEADLTFKYWVQIDGKYKYFRSVNQLKKILPIKKMIIEEYMTQNKVNINNPSQVLILYQHLFLEK
ncbi:hypothetical protein BSYN_03460 [Bacteroides sedimenti]|uniref:DUF4412 domain-containing protein n=2 Tax=Bacteroides sedimenti TaxID=2136147 RepID=A0ABN6Z719_9BACE